MPSWQKLTPLDLKYAEDPLKTAAALLERRGGLKGGKARAEKLSSEEWTAIARKAAQARWKKN